MNRYVMHKILLLLAGIIGASSWFLKPTTLDLQGKARIGFNSHQFWLVSADDKHLIVADRRWMGSFDNYPTAGISVKGRDNRIDNWGLEKWLEEVSDPGNPALIDKPKICEAMPYNLCEYIGYKKIRSYIFGKWQAVEFETSAASGGATHTVIDTNDYLYDIYYTFTGMTDKKDLTPRAYIQLLKSFRK